MKLNEAIQANTKILLKTTTTTLFNSLRSAEPIRTGKLSAFKKILYSFQAYAQEQGGNPQSASRLAGFILFLFQLEDLSTFLGEQLATATNLRKDYIDKAKEETVPEGQEPIEPTLEQIFGTQSKNLKSQIQAILLGRASMTRDVFLTNFKKNTTVLRPSVLMNAMDVAKLPDQFMQLTLDQLTAFVKAIEFPSKRLLVLRRILGSVKQDDLVANFFGLKPLRG